MDNMQNNDSNRGISMTYLQQNFMIAQFPINPNLNKTFSSQNKQGLNPW